jgi:hypothetical protein
MFNAEIPNKLILIAAEAIAQPSCGKMHFLMLDTAEWQVLIHLDPSVGEMAEDIYFIVRYRPLKVLDCVVANAYTGCLEKEEKPFVSLQDCVTEAIEHFHEIEAEAV